MANTLLIPIFKAGTFTDMNGKTITYTQKDLEKIETAYNNERTEKNYAPLVLGHPPDDKPSYGQVVSLKILKDKLFAFADMVDDKLIEALKSGAYRFCSIKLNDKATLRHVGFLGAYPPAVKGLGDTFIISNDSDITELGIQLEKGNCFAEFDLFSKVKTDSEFAEFLEDDLKNKSENADMESEKEKIHKEIEELKELIKKAEAIIEANNKQIKELENAE